jgi:hypothetical protein
VHGRYDETTPLRTEAEPLFKLLPEPKQLFVYDGGHMASPEVVIQTVGGWLDKVMGSIRRE